MNPRIVCVTGSRTWDKPRPIVAALARMKALGAITLVHGAAKGADSLADQAGRALFGKTNVHPYEAQWDLVGPSAGPIRNQRMLIESRCDIVLAFADDLGTSRGTAHMVKIATVATFVKHIYHYSSKSGWHHIKGETITT